MRVITIDKERLEEVAEVRFEWSDIIEFVEVLSAYAQRNYLNLPPHILQVVGRISTKQNRRFETDARCAVVEFVEFIWRSRGGGSGGAYYSKETRDAEGPLIELLTALFATNSETPPARMTLLHDLKASIDPDAARQRRRKRKI